MEIENSSESSTIQISKLNYWTIIVLTIKFSWDLKDVAKEAGVSTKTCERVLDQFEKTGNPVKQIGNPHGYKKYDLPPLSDRKKREAISSIEKSAIVALASFNHTRSEIMDYSKVSKNIIPAVLKEFKEKGTVRTQPKSKPTRNELLKNPKAVNAICSFVEDLNDKNQLVTIKMIRNFLKTDWMTDLSKDSVERLMHSLGFHAIKPKTIPFLTEEHQMARKQHAELEMKKSWDNIIFTDECSVQLYRNTKKTWVSTINPPQIAQPKNPKLSIMVWAGISKLGKTKLHFCDKGTKINQDTYLQILQECLLEFGENVHKNQWDFLQDNAPSHKAKKVMEFLIQNVPGRVINHPAKSPDMNPIEHMWSILKANVELSQPKSLVELKALMDEVWNSISLETIRKTIDHVHDKTLSTVIYCNGKWPNTRSTKLMIQQKEKMDEEKDLF